MFAQQLPIHPFTGLTALGVLPNGRIVWPIKGGSGDGDGDPGAGASDGDSEPGGQPAGGGDGAEGATTWDSLFAGEDPAAVRKALEESRKWERRAKENKTKLDELEPLAKKAREAEEARKTDLEKLTERAASAEKERDHHAVTATRLQVAIEKGLTASQAKRLVGSTREELEADADELLADLKGSDKPKDPPLAKDVIPGRPKDGNPPAGEDAPDPKKIARTALNRNHH
jgi:hypothetical protein